MLIGMSNYGKAPDPVLALARDMNKYTRFTAKPMRGHGNVTGADNVVCTKSRSCSSETSAALA